MPCAVSCAMQYRLGLGIAADSQLLQVYSCPVLMHPHRYRLQVNSCHALVTVPASIPSPSVPRICSVEDAV